MRAALLLAFVLASGCLTTITDQPRYSLYGAFTADATQADYDEVGRLVKNETGRDLALMKSFPPQFRVDDLGNAQCERLHDALKDKPYLGRLDACRPEGAPEPVEETTQSSLYGAFTEDSTQADYEEVGRLVELHTGQREFTIMESFPPQFRVFDMTPSQCQSLRGALVGKPYLRTLGECQPMEASADPEEPVSSPSNRETRSEGPWPTLR